MNTILVFLVLTKFYSVLTYGSHSDQEFYRKCVNAIYRECTHQSEFTEQEIENARIYIQNRYNNLENPAFRPLKPPCKKLHVRKDFKCLTHKEKLELIAAVKEIYRNGEQTRLSLWPHAVYWGQTHKFNDFFPYHRWQNNEIDKALKRVNPRVNLPYWTANEEFDRPELSIIWDYLGRAGNHESNYCVTDGPFVDIKPCVKRHWINDTYIRSWIPIEYYDTVIQNAITATDINLLDSNTHFKFHISIGGTEGQMSVPNAPYDFSFYLYHNWVIDVMTFKWLLQNDQHLIPDTYGGGPIYDWEIDRLRPANITRDIMVYFNVSVLEAYQLTFGELCYVNDVIIEAINEITGNKRPELPFNYKKLPKDLLKKYYPTFYSGNYGPFDYLSQPVMQCNRQCKPIRQTEDFVNTIEGRALLERLKYLALFDEKGFYLMNENLHRTFTDDLNMAGYCSPYIIS